MATRIVQEAMALIGKIEEYDEKESWIEYTGHMEQYFAANEILDNGKNRAVLLSVQARNWGFWKGVRIDRNIY